MIKLHFQHDEDEEESKEELEIIKAALHDSLDEEMGNIGGFHYTNQERTIKYYISFDQETSSMEDGGSDTDEEDDSNQAEKILDVLVPPAEILVDGVVSIRRVSS